MIKSNELRIGNWVNFSYTYKKEVITRPCSVAILDRDFLLVNDKGDYLSLYYETDSIQPIPLSGELLVKCGFKYGTTEGITSFEYDDNDPEGTTHYWDKPIIATELVDSHNISIVKWGEQEYFTFQLERGFYRQKIKYLHQLQNLYFALTSEELIINF